MKRITLTSLLLLSTLLEAVNFDTFIGVEAGSTELNLQHSDFERGESFGARIGFVKNTGRVFINANTTNLDTADLNTFAVNFDAITPSQYRFNDYFALRGFLGVHGGLAQLKLDNFNDDEGGMGGGQAGVFLDFPYDISLEIGYKATWAALDVGVQSVKNYQMIYAAYNYTF